MRLLLDTHIWLWGMLTPERVSPAIKAELGRPDAEVCLSTVSLWEAVQLIEKGRVRLPGLDQLVADLMRTGAIRLIAVTPAIALEMGRTPEELRDPADRLLLATAHVEGMKLITADRRLQAYLKDQR